MLNLLKNQKHMSRNEIIALLNTTPDAFSAFETYYKEQVLAEEQPDIMNLFGVNAKQAAKMGKGKMQAASPVDTTDHKSEIIGRIVKELVGLTSTFVYDGEKASYVQRNGLVDHKNQVKREEVMNFPEDKRPQLTGYLRKADCDGNSSDVLLIMYKQMLKAKTEKQQKEFYHVFRQGLDILDIDPIIYEFLGMNQNAMGNWLPQLIKASDTTGFFKIPKTVIAKVPLSMLQLTRLDYFQLTQATKDIVNRWAMEVFGLDPEKDYFIKTGTYSNKFDFRNCCIQDADEVKEIGEYLLYISFSAMMMASPLTSPVIYGVSTTNEWVVREFIPDKENNPVIYKGLPLHTEYRVFIDCDTDKVLGIVPYWDPDVMEKRFAENRDGHDKHDAISFKMHEETLMNRYRANKEKLLWQVERILPSLALEGQWSLDIMQNGDDFWLIDMALASASAGYDKAVAPELRRERPERWLPDLEKFVNP